jgi:hypothetical protein
MTVGMEPTPELRALSEAGHIVEASPHTWPDYDIILGPKCWRYLPDMSDKWLPLILKEARAKQPKKAKKGTDGTPAM